MPLYRENGYGFGQPRTRHRTFSGIEPSKPVIDGGLVFRLA